MATQVRLTDAVQGATHEPITFTWGIDLTDVLSISGTKQELGGDTVTVLDGTFEVTDDAAGIVEWTLGAGDVGTAGRFLVQFKAQFAGDYDRTIEGNWRVHSSQGAGVVPAEMLVGVTESQAAFLDDINITSPTDGQVLTWDAVEGEWVNDDAAGGGLANIVEDTTPQLGGNLDLNGFAITGLVIGTDVQAYDAGLADIAALAVTDGNIIVGDGANWTAESGATARASLGAAAAADLTSHTGNTSNPHSVTAAQVGAQALDGELTALAGLTSAANQLPYFTGSGTAALTTLSSAGRDLIDDADNTAQRTTLGLGTLATQNGSFTGGGTLATGGFTLTVPATGTAALLGITNVFTAAQHFPDGTNSAPGVSFASDPDTGMYIAGGNILGFSTGGVQRGRFTGTKLILSVAVDSDSSLAQTFRLSDAVTNAISTVATIGHNTSGTAAAGFGTGISLQGESSTTSDQDMASIQALWATATHASRKARVLFNVYDTAVREAIRIEASGSAPMVGFLGAAAVVRAAHIADPSGGGVIDAEARTAINAILVVLENLGFNATS